MRPVGPTEAKAHWREFFAQDLTPLSIYRRLKQISSHAFLFESVTGGDQVSRYSFLGSAPAEVCRLYRDRLEVEDAGGRETIRDQPLEALHERLRSVHTVAHRLPFTGGYVGYFGYDVARLTETLPEAPTDPYDLPIACLARFDAVVVFDHARQRVTALANEIDDRVSQQQALRSLEQLAELLLDARRERPAVPVGSGAGRKPRGMHPLVSAKRFEASVRKAQEYVYAGDILQAVLARRWEVATEVDAESLYRAVRLINPSPYMVLLETGDVALVGASPEMLVRKTGSRLETRPIAGTRPRGRTVEEDRALAADLLADAKERAEHVMLVDLGRNDLGRVAEPGSVAVESFMEVERYSHVMHLVSSVVAQIGPGKDALDALLACFPAGTVSGAPKIRAMEIIDELESEARGPYAGAIGYLSYNGDMDTCITIRTLVVHGDSVSVTAGAGIVADSVPEKEAEETENKAAALLAAIDLAASLEGSR